MAATLNDPYGGAPRTWTQPMTSGGGGDTNWAGARDDPFAYTKGSLLTPWEGRFDSSGYGGGHSAPKYTAFKYGDFKFQAPKVGQFGEVYNDPAAFRFADFAGPRDFQAPTAEDMRADPGYQARMDAVKNAQVAGAAHSGVLRSGGFQKGLAQAVGDQASQEYGNVYARRAGEHDRNRQEAESNYGINQGNTFQAFNTNTANRLAGYGTRQGAWQANANTALQEGELGYNIATGTWDRNYQKARTSWQDEAQHRAQQAAASNAGAQQNYARDLADYTRARDEFWTNQDRQSGLLDREADRGMQAADRYAGYTSGAYGAMGDYAMGGANARASGTMGSGNAWGNFAGDVGNTIGGLAMYGGLYGGGGSAPRPAQGGGGYTPTPYAGSNNPYYYGAVRRGSVQPITYTGGWDPNEQVG